MYSHTFRVYEDENNNGVDDAEGASGSEGNKLIWEMKKPLDSGDKDGNDISLQSGDTYKIMIAFWDDKPPHSSATYTNKMEGNTQFIIMTVGSPIDRTFGEIIGTTVLLASLAIAVVLIKYGIPVILK